MPNVLLICPHFPPTAASGSFRLLGFARHLPKFGWETSVVARSPVRSEPQDPLLASQIPVRCHVTYVDPPTGRVPLLIDRGLRAAGILDKSWSWQRSAYKSCRRVIVGRQVDAIVTSSPPHSVHLLGLALKRRFGLPWIADFRDPWIGDNPAHGLSRFAARFEGKVLRGADAVVANAPLAQQVLAKAHPGIAHKLVTITNGYDPEAIPLRKPEATQPSPITILHAGELYAGRDPRPLLDAIASLKGNIPCLPDFKVTFLGRHKWSGLDLPGEIKSRGCEDVVELIEHLPYADAKQRMVDAGILLLLDSPGRLAGVPAKLYEYVGSRRPILALAEHESDSAWVLRESGVVFQIADPTNPSDIRGALSKLLTRGSDLQPVSTRERVFRFTREEGAQRLAAKLQSLLTSHQSNVKPASAGFSLVEPNAFADESSSLPAAAGSKAV